MSRRQAVKSFYIADDPYAEADTGDDEDGLKAAWEQFAAELEDDGGNGLNFDELEDLKGLDEELGGDGSSSNGDGADAGFEWDVLNKITIPILQEQEDIKAIKARKRMSIAAEVWYDDVQLVEDTGEDTAEVDWYSPEVLPPGQYYIDDDVDEEETKKAEAEVKTHIEKTFKKIEDARKSMVLDISDNKSLHSDGSSSKNSTGSLHTDGGGDFSNDFLPSTEQVIKEAKIEIEPVRRIPISKSNFMKKVNAGEIHVTPSKLTSKGAPPPVRKLGISKAEMLRRVRANKRNGKGKAAAGKPPPPPPGVLRGATNPKASPRTRPGGPPPPKQSAKGRAGVPPPPPPGQSPKGRAGVPPPPPPGAKGSSSQASTDTPPPPPPPGHKGSFRGPPPPGPPRSPMAVPKKGSTRRPPGPPPPPTTATRGSKTSIATYVSTNSSQGNVPNGSSRRRPSNPPPGQRTSVPPPRPKTPPRTRRPSNPPPR